MNVISKWFRGTGRGGETPASTATQRIVRRSNGLNELTGLLRTDEPLRVLDLGPTSPQNITYLTNLGHRIHNEDLLLPSRDPSLLQPGEDGEQVMNVARFMGENLVYEKEFFDAVLCWDMPDYLHADLVKPVVQRLHSVMKPKGLLLGFFHTRDAGPDAPYHRYHITGADTLELQRMSPIGREAPGRYGDIRLLRVFNNRHIENLFHDFTSIKFFLGRDNIREVLVVR